MANLRKMRQQYQKEQERKKKRQKRTFSFCFCLTILISLAMIIICAINQEFLLWTEVVLTAAWGIFSAFFGVCLKKKLWFFSEAYFLKGGWVDEKGAWRGSVFQFVLAILIFSGTLIHLLIRILR